MRSHIWTWKGPAQYTEYLDSQLYVGAGWDFSITSSMEWAPCMSDVYVRKRDVHGFQVTKELHRANADEFESVVAQFPFTPFSLVCLHNEG